MPLMVCRESPLALAAIAVLREQSILSLHADPAGIILRTRQRIGSEHGEAATEPLGGLHGEGIVGTVGRVVNELNTPERRVRSTAVYVPYCSRERLIYGAEELEFAAD